MIKFINLKIIIILLINSNGKNVGSEGKISKRLVITKEKLDIEDRYTSWNQIKYSIFEIFS